MVHRKPGSIQGDLKQGREGEKKKWNIQYGLHLTVWSEMGKIMEEGEACLMFVPRKVIVNQKQCPA